MKSSGEEAMEGPGEGAGARIDRYELIEELGEGGMGTVWAAQQSQPVKRRVALKIIKLGMDTREVVVRFEAERQALALMDHVHIAKVLDGGATAEGRPYFVMELVQGQPITEYCDREMLGLRDRLELFRKVCAAIQHAHQKGIIHRDIKPSNVLVESREGEPVPKVIDFGIAKATGAELTQKTLFTQHAQIIGTPEYMAPEQAEIGGTDIDTRVDVYSLGVLLYELLTGTKPFDMRQILASGYDEMLRTIREVDPAKPSTRVSTLGDAATPIATNRHVPVDGLAKRLRGDLDWIVMKALEKDRARRYETANGLASDVERYLKDEPVSAVPPSPLYRLRKLMRRRKKSVAVAAVLFLTFVGGATGTAWQGWKAVRLNRDLDAALTAEQAALAEKEVERTKAVRNAERAREAEAKAQLRAAEFEAVAEFQGEQLGTVDAEVMGRRLRASLLAVSPAEGRAALETLLQDINFTDIALRNLEENLFQRSIAAIDDRFADQASLRARLLQVVATTAESIGLIDLAQDPMERALALRRELFGEDHAETLHSVNELGRLHHLHGRFEEAERLLRSAHAGRRAVLGEYDPDTLASLNNVASVVLDQGRWEEAEAMHREAYEKLLATLGERDHFTNVALANWALALQNVGRLEESEERYRQSLALDRAILGDDDPTTLSALSNLGLLLKTRKKLDEAEVFAREAVDRSRRVLGNEESSTLVAIINLASILHDQGRYDEAEPLYREVLETSRSVLGRIHPITLGSLNNLANMLGQMGEIEESEKLYREAIAGAQRAWGALHPNTLSSTFSLGGVLQGQGRLQEAEGLLTTAVRGFRISLGEDHPTAQRATFLLTGVLEARVSEARREGDATSLGEALERFGVHRIEGGAGDQAEELLTEALELLYAELPEDDPRLARVLSALGEAVFLQGRFEEAEGVLLESWSLVETSPLDEISPPARSIAAGIAERVGRLYEAWHAQAPTAGHDRAADGWRDTASELAGD